MTATCLKGFVDAWIADSHLWVRMAKVGSAQRLSPGNAIQNFHIIWMTKAQHATFLPANHSAVLFIPSLWKLSALPCRFSTKVKNCTRWHGLAGTHSQENRA